MGGKLIPGVNDLQTVRPDLAKQWHPFRNGELTPSDVCVYSSRKVWWQVEEVRFGKHFLLEWQALISNRAGGAGCPYTSVPPKKLMKGFNDLASVNPEVAALWHPEKNGSLSPDMVFACAQRKFWWRHTVEKDGKTYIHEWQAFPQYVRPGSCPVCHGTQCMPGYNDLFSAAPELAAQWDWQRNQNLSPQEITFGSNRKVHWVCDLCGHGWTASVHNRVMGAGCPKCAQRYGTSFAEQALYFYLKQVFPDCVNRDTTALEGHELDLYLPSIGVAVEYNGLWSHSTPRKKELDRQKRKLCEQKGILLIEVNESKNKNCHDPQRHQIYCVERQDYSHLIPVMDAISSELMERGDLRQPILVCLERDRQKIYGQYLGSIRERSLGALYPHLLEQWDTQRNGGLSPYAVLAGSGAKVHWMHTVTRDGTTFVHRWSSQVCSRTLRGDGCPICGGKQVLAGYNDLASTFPKLVKEWDFEKNQPLKPDQITPGSQKSVWWKHTVKTEHGESVHSWRASVRARVSGTGCPVCDGKIILAGFNDLATTHPQLAAQWDQEKNELLPTEISYGYAKKVWWKHTVTDRFGKIWVHSWQASPNSRTNRSSGCPYCANKKVLPGFNDLQTAFPELAEKWDAQKNAPLTPRDVTPATPQKVWWTDRQRPASVADRTKYLRKRQEHGTPPADQKPKCRQK